MGENSSIQWTHHTFNPWVGCTKVSPGCANCYAETFDARFRGAKPSRWGVGAPRTRTSEANWRKPLKWNREAEKAGERHRVFCASLADVFDAEVPDEWRLGLYALILSTPYLDWLLLTKRPERIARPDFGAVNEAARNLGLGVVLPTQRHGMVPGGWWPSNVWLGVTVENQEQAERRIQPLLAQPATVRFLSCEPLLGPVDLTCWLDEDENGNALQWVIIGGESGTKARLFDLAWARDLVSQCLTYDVAPFVKQVGYRASDPINGLAGAGLAVHPDAADLVSRRLRDPHGGDPAEWPEDLRVRQFPEVRP